MTKHTKNLSFFKPNLALAGVYAAQAAMIFIAFFAAGSPAFAQPSSPEATLKPIVITAPAPRQQLDLGGFGDAPLRETPVSATVIDGVQIKASGAQKLADLFKFDASVSDAYNAVGYIDYATLRGFVIDNKFNIRRDGLPISGDTAIGLANKDRIEILKGTSGIQAGTSAPGGLVNYVIKRPTLKPTRSVDLSADSNGQLGAALDLGGRFGQGNSQGYRLNVATDRLQSAAPSTRGNRQQLALALDSRIGQDGLLEAEFEYSRQSQPNVPGLSVLGSTGVLPPANPKLNLNRQAWSQPTEFEGLTGSLRYQAAINDQWQWSAHLANQRLKTNDRIAFPFGCTDSNGIDYYADRFCPNGDADIYDFRSENERRNKTAAQFKLDGSFQTGRLHHALSLGLLQSQFRIQLPDSAFGPSPAGTLNLAGPTQPIPANPSLTVPGNTQREKTTEFFATDVIAWNEHFKTWLGLRHTRLQRSDALSPPEYSLSFTVPWLAASYSVNDYILYASHGQGIESDIAPRSFNVANPGQLLPAKRSQQTEIGVKSSPSNMQWHATLFQITRPMTNLDACSLTSNQRCLLQADGQATHTGIELAAQTRLAAWQLDGSATVLRAKREHSSTASINGLKPANVPSHILRLNAAYRIAPQWQLGAHLSHEGRRAIVPDNSLMLPAWTRLDASLKWETQTSSIKTTWQLAINNLLDKRFFQESPHQFGHAYLFPAAPRSLRLAASFAL
jgi:iron complex outermembrane recepter protein